MKKNETSQKNGVNISVAVLNVNIAKCEKKKSLIETIGKLLKKIH